MSFFSELKRRNVVKVALLYVVASWIVLQVTDVLVSILPVPGWSAAPGSAPAAGSITCASRG